MALKQSLDGSSDRSHICVVSVHDKVYPHGQGLRGAAGWAKPDDIVLGVMANRVAADAAIGLPAVFTVPIRTIFGGALDPVPILPLGAGGLVAPQALGVVIGQFGAIPVWACVVPGRLGLSEADAVDH